MKGMSRLRMQSWLWVSAFSLMFLLLIVWQMPGTIAIRYSLLAMLLLLSLMLSFRCPAKNQQRTLVRMPLIWLAILTGWVVLVIVLWGVEPSLSWKEFRGQWLTALGAGLVGALLAGAAQAESSLRVTALVMTAFWALLVQVVLHDVLDIWYFLLTGSLPFRQAPVLYLSEIFGYAWEGRSITQAFTGNSGDKFSYVNNILAALVVAEVLHRVMRKERWLNIGPLVLILTVFAILVCTYLLKFRNGNVGLLLLICFGTATALIYKARKWRLWQLGAMGLVVFGLLSAFATLLFQADSRWQGFLETVPIALDTEAHQSWRKNDIPFDRLSNGLPLDGTAYLRISWGVEGLKLMADQPLGVGYNRNAFGDAIDRKYEMNGAYRGGHSHSGLVDFGIANGIPGLLLWLLFLGALFYTGWLAFMRGQIAPGLTLMFIVSGFLSRSIVDSNLRDHMLQQFMFLVMLFAFSLPRSKQAENTLDD